MLKKEGFFIEQNNKKMQEEPAIDCLRESAFWDEILHNDALLIMIFKTAVSQRLTIFQKITLRNI